MTMSVRNIDLITDTVGVANVQKGLVTFKPADLERLLNTARRQGESMAQFGEVPLAIVIAAGGKVVVGPEHAQKLRNKQLWRFDNPATGCVEFDAQDRA